MDGRRGPGLQQPVLTLFTEETRVVIGHGLGLDTVGRGRLEVGSMELEQPLGGFGGDIEPVLRQDG